MKTVIDRTLRRGAAMPAVLVLVGIGLLAQTAPTCVPPLDTIGTQIDDGQAGPTIGQVVDASRILTPEELEQLRLNSDGNEHLIVFLGHVPGPEGPEGPWGMAGPPGPVGPQGVEGRRGFQGVQGVQGPPGQGSLIGEIRMWAGPNDAVPALWLPCDGSVMSRTQFSVLFGVIGTNYGPGDGSTTYNIPNFSNRSPMGADTHVNGLPHTSVSGPSTVFGGAPMHVLSPAEMPGHDHDMSHLHDLQGAFGGGTGSTHVQFLDSSVPTNLPTGPSSQQFTTPKGGGLAHNNLHPYFAITYLIYAGQ